MTRLALSLAIGGALIAGVLALFIYWGASSCAPQTQVQTSPQPPTQNSSKAIRVPVRVVGLDGQPLAGMFPIATESPNAFDKPVAQGPLTETNGKSVIYLDPDRWLYVRAWDPQLQYFANNYFDVPPGNAPISQELEIVMVKGATLRARLFRPDSNPVANENVGLMMFHPEKGPWWPSDANTDNEGNVVFSKVPAGKFLLKIKALESGRIDLPAVFLPPGEEVNLGNIQLIPE